MGTTSDAAGFKPDADGQVRQNRGGRPKGSKSRVDKTLKGVLKRRLDKPSIAFLERVITNNLDLDLDGHTIMKEKKGEGGTVVEEVTVLPVVTIPQRLEAVKLAWERAYGRPTQTVELPPPANPEEKGIPIGGSKEQFMGGLRTLKNGRKAA